jgi:hypothetical protein
MKSGDIFRKSLDSPFLKIVINRQAQKPEDKSFKREGYLMACKTGGKAKAAPKAKPAPKKKK